MDMIQEGYHETADPVRSCIAIESLVSKQTQTYLLIRTIHSSDLSSYTLPIIAVRHQGQCCKA